MDVNIVWIWLLKTIWKLGRLLNFWEIINLTRESNMLNDIYNQINEAVAFETGLEQRACELIKKIAGRATNKIEFIQTEIKRGNLENEKVLVAEFINWLKEIEKEVLKRESY